MLWHAAGRVGLIAAIAQSIHLLLSAPTLAEERWPEQPVVWPTLPQPKLWPGDAWELRVHPNEVASHPSVFIRANHQTVLPGGLFSVRTVGMFFMHRADLDLFTGPLHAIGPQVRILPHGHPLQALERVDNGSDGGRVRDDIFGDGFALWQPSTDSPIPDWFELSHESEWGRAPHHPISHYRSALDRRRSQHIPPL